MAQTWPNPQVKKKKNTLPLKCMDGVDGVLGCFWCEFTLMPLKMEIMPLCQKHKVEIAMWLPK